MNDRETPVTILMADDDHDDIFLTRDALSKGSILSELRSVADGVELLEYLRHEGAYEDPAAAPRPNLILLDLNMPRMTGLEALREIKKDPALRSIPVVVLTTSKSDEDVRKSYDLGANSFLTKPQDFRALVQAMKTLEDYWLSTVRLPG